MLEASHLNKIYKSGFLGREKTIAVKDVSFSVSEGERFGLIGESGSGKTTLTRMIGGLLKPESGSILFEGQELTKAGAAQWHELRRKIQIVFQHPQMTFHPRKDIYFACAEPIRLYHLAHRISEREMVGHMMKRVGISEDQWHKYPHEISGGQAQRIAIARALSLNPKLLICDELTSMLDVSVQAQILRLLLRANEKYNVALLFISHDLDVIRAVCQRVAVMYQGEIVETGTTEEVFCHPKHAYTKKLLKAHIPMWDTCISENK